MFVSTEKKKIPVCLSTEFMVPVSVSVQMFTVHEPHNVQCFPLQRIQKSNEQGHKLFFQTVINLHFDIISSLCPGCSI